MEKFELTRSRIDQDPQHQWGFGHLRIAERFDANIGNMLIQMENSAICALGLLGQKKEREKQANKGIR